MVQNLSEVVGKKVSVLMGTGPKGTIRAKGVLVDANDEGGLITLQTESSGMMGGGKKRLLVFSLFSVIGVEIEE